MILVFNELSADEPARTRQAARVRMKDMLEAVAALAGGRAANLTAVDSFDLYGMRLTTDYDLTGWLRDRAVDRDLRNFFWTISTKLDDLDIGEAVRDRFYLSEFHVGNRNAPGLGLAFLLGTVAVSLPSEERWRRVRIRLRYTWLENDGTERRRDVVAINVADGGHAASAIDETSKQARVALTASPALLADRKRACFPHLDFGPDVDDQLARVPVEMLHRIIAKLIVLDDVVRRWRRDAAESPVLPKIHSESEPTMQQYGDRRVFRSASGASETFRLHAMVGDRYRIHLRIDRRDRSVEIGYVGEHLPTVKFPR